MNITNSMKKVQINYLKSLYRAFFLAKDCEEYDEKWYNDPSSYPHKGELEGSYYGKVNTLIELGILTEQEQKEIEKTVELFIDATENMLKSLPDNLNKTDSNLYSVQLYELEILFGDIGFAVLDLVINKQPLMNDQEIVEYAIEELFSSSEFIDLIVPKLKEKFVLEVSIVNRELKK